MIPNWRLAWQLPHGALSGCCLSGVGTPWLNAQFHDYAFAPSAIAEVVPAPEGEAITFACLEPVIQEV